MKDEREPMQDLQELERRITLALDRIARGVEVLEGVTVVSSGQAGAAETAEVMRLTEALQAERDANAQLEERLRLLHARMEAGNAPLAARLERLTAQIDAQGIELSRLKSVNVQLRETLRALQEAAEQGLADPALVNKALQAELDALRATRAAEVAELDGILAELKPLIAEAADA